MFYYKDLRILIKFLYCMHMSAAFFFSTIQLLPYQWLSFSELAELSMFSSSVSVWICFSSVTSLCLAFVLYFTSRQIMQASCIHGVTLVGNA